MWVINDIIQYGKTIDTTLKISLIIILVGLLANWIGLTFIKRIENNKTIKNNFTNTLITIVCLFLLSLWLKELKTFVLSMAAFSVAIVVALKETISGFIAAIVMSSNKTFQPGDVIEINNIKGKVFRRTWLFTHLIQNTGTNHEKDVLIPNNWFILHPLAHISSQEEKSIADVSIFIDGTQNPVPATEIMKQAGLNFFKNKGYDGNIDMEIIPLDIKSTQIKMYARVNADDRFLIKLEVIKGFWEKYKEIEKELTKEEDKNEN